jgi:hypothetical protein
MAPPPIFPLNTETDPLHTLSPSMNVAAVKLLAKFDPDLGLRMRRDQILTIPVR